jgi:hypothetical protein
LPDSALLDLVDVRHEPQLELPLFEGHGYPAPVVDHETVARAFLERYAREVRAPA